jgi:hypothetical protein
MFVASSRASFNRAEWARQAWDHPCGVFCRAISGGMSLSFTLTGSPALYGGKRILGRAIDVLRGPEYALDQRLRLRLVGHAQHAG